MLSQSIPKIDDADLLFVIGTSLTVQPFAKLAALAPQRCPRVLVNLDFAGDIGTRQDDVLLFGRSDDVLRDLARALGWEAALDAEWAKTALPASASPSPVAITPLPLPVRAGPLAQALAPHEQVEMGHVGSNGTSTPTAAEWSEKLVAAESLSERLRLALESSEKVVPLLEDAAVTFAARTLSSEELMLASNAGCESPVDDSMPLHLSAAPMVVVGKS